MEQIISTKENINKLKIITWNVRSIRSLNSFQNFKSQIAGIVSHSIDIIILTESWTDSYDKFNPYKLDNYRLFSCCRKDKSGGGIVIYVHHRHTVKMINNESLNYMEYLTLEMLLNGTKMNIHAVYRPPNSNLNMFLQKLEHLCTTDEFMIIAGDLNINKFNVDNATSQFLDIVNSFGGIITNDAITRSKSNTLIDYFISFNSPTNQTISTLTSSELLISDHNLLLSLISTNAPKTTQNIITRKNCDYEKLKENFEWNENLMSNLSASQSYDYLVDAIQHAQNCSTIISRVRIRSSVDAPVWADTRYHILQNKAENMQKKINKLSKLCKPTTKLKCKLNDLKNIIESHGIETSRKFYSNAIKNNEHNSWKIINTILGKGKNKDDIVLRENDILITDPLEISELFNDKFLMEIPSISKEIMYNGPVINECIYFDAVSEREVMNVINNLNDKKAAGIDSILPTIIKQLKDKLITPLTIVINKIFRDAEYPDSLKSAKIVPIHKKGNVNDINNYRPISLLPIINKITERIILNRLQDFMEDQGINDSEQYGYKKGIGTSDAIQKFTHDVLSHLDKNECVIVVFMDLSSAFDTLDREVLMKKLSYLGIKGHVLDIIKSYFHNRTQTVQIGTACSRTAINDHGVAQGSILGPHLFNTILLDSPIITSSRIKFADDNVIYRNCKKEDIISTLNEVKNDIKLMASHFDSCGLNLNYSKTKFMIMGGNRVNDTDLIALEVDEATQIDRVYSHKFLGIMIEDGLCLNEQFESLVNKLTQVCRVLSIIKHHLPTEMLLDFFNGHFMSHLYYCSFIYAKLSIEQIQRLQRLQNRCIKKIFSLDIQHSTLDLFKTYMPNTLPVVGVIYYSMMVYIKKSLLTNKPELLEFTINDSNRRSSGELVPCRYRKKHCLGHDIGYLGVILYNQLSKDLTEEANLKKFKINLKSYLITKVDLLLDGDQQKTRRIS